jgi:hypothetical protein
MNTEILVIGAILYFIFVCKEGFMNSSLVTIYNKNLNTDNEYPDKKQFYTTANHNKVKMGREQGTLLGNSNYRMVDNTIKEPQHGSYSAFLEVNGFRSFDQFYHAPISEKTHHFDVSYDRVFGNDLDIIQGEDINKYELYRLEEERDQKIHNPYYLHGHPENNSKILYSEEIQDMFLKVKGITNRHTDIGITGGGHHDHGL